MCYGNSFLDLFGFFVNFELHHLELVVFGGFLFFTFSDLLKLGLLNVGFETYSAFAVIGPDVVIVWIQRDEVVLSLGFCLFF